MVLLLVICLSIFYRQSLSIFASLTSRRRSLLQAAVLRRGSGDEQLLEDHVDSRLAALGCFAAHMLESGEKEDLARLAENYRKMDNTNLDLL